MGLGNHPPFATKAEYVTARIVSAVSPYHAVILVGKGPTLQVRQANNTDDPARVYWAGPVRAEPGGGGSVRGAPSVAITLDYPCIARVAPGQSLQAGDYASINGSGQLILDAENPSFVIQQSETDGASSVPAYALVDRLAVEGEPPAKLVRFKMKSHLPLGGKGKAIQIGTGLGYTEIGSQFPIKDPWTEPGSWRDDTTVDEQDGSYMGWCLIPDNPEIADGSFEGGAFEGQAFREIIWMEQIATYINFTATGATTKDEQDAAAPWTVTATVDEWYQGKDPADAFSSITLYDPQQLFPYVMECSKGKARYNEKEHRYEIVNVNQMAFAATATLGSDMCEDGSASLTGATAASFSPFGMNPDIETAENPHKLCGVAGAQVFLMFNAKWGNECEEAETTTGQWEVIQVEHREISVIIDHRIVEIAGDPDCCQHQIKRINLCAMSCDEIESIEWEIVPGPDDCCQEEPPEGCCGCEPFPMTGTTVLEAVMTGAQEGSGDIPQSDTLPEGVCAQFEGRIDFSSSPCLGITGQDITVTCYEATGVLEVSPLTIAGGICNADLDSIEVNECNPFKATIKYKLSESVFGGCNPCNVDDEITLVLTEKEP